MSTYICTTPFTSHMQRKYKKEQSIDQREYNTLTFSEREKFSIEVGYKKQGEDSLPIVDQSIVVSVII